MRVILLNLLLHKFEKRSSLDLKPQWNIVIDALIKCLIRLPLYKLIDLDVLVSWSTVVVSQGHETKIRATLQKTSLT